MSTILLRRGTSAQWATANPILDPGEAGFEVDTGKLKIGDGTTAWNSLAYATVLPSDARLSDARTPTAHTHAAADVTSGTLDVARLPVGAGAAQVAAGNHAHTGVYDPAGTAASAVAAHEADTTAVHGIADTSQLVLTSDGRLSDARTPTAHTHAPSEITGTAVVTTDSRLSDARTPTAHTHPGSDITSGTVDVARLPTGTTSTSVLAPTVVDAAGDLIIGTGADTVARLATGTPGQILGTSNTGNKTAWKDRPGAVHLPSGAIAETIPLGRVASTLMSHFVTLSTGRLLLVGLELFAGQTVTNISFTSGTTAAGTPTNWWFGLWGANRVCLGVTADQTSTAWGTSTTKTLALGTPVSITADGLYYVGVMVKATTVPTLICVAGATVIAQTAPVTCGTSNTGMTTPPSVGSTANALTGQANRPYAWVS